MTIQPHHVIAGRYRLLRPLAEGGMGTLWIARHEELQTELALKFVTGLEPSPTAIERFKHEARAAAQLRGRHIVHIYDFGFDGEQPFIAMELLRGESFARLIERRAPVALDAALHWFRQMIAGLRLAHGAGIVHRDIKPSNLFLAEDDDQLVVKLLDFGIAKPTNAAAATTATTTTGMIIGSPGYMSPEQARGQRVDARSDLWSAAVVLYELVTGHVLFASAHAGDSIAKTCSEPVPPASSFVSALPKSVDAFFARALERDPERRFANAEQLLSAFERACGGNAEFELPRAPAGRDGDARSEQVREGPTQPVEIAAASGAYELAWNRDARGARASRRWLLLLAALAPLLALSWPDSERALEPPQPVVPQPPPALTRQPQPSQPTPRAADSVESEPSIGLALGASGQPPVSPEASSAPATKVAAPARGGERARPAASQAAAAQHSESSARAPLPGKLESPEPADSERADSALPPRKVDPFSGLALE